MAANSNHVDDAYVGSLVKDAAILDSDRRSGSGDGRDRALVYILRSAIADTPEGDVVDFGGAAEVLILRVLREMDLCGRRLWSIGGRGASLGPPCCDPRSTNTHTTTLHMQDPQAPL